MIDIKYMGFIDQFISFGKPVNGRMMKPGENKWRKVMAIWIVLFGFLFQIALIGGFEDEVS